MSTGRPTAQHLIVAHAAPDPSWGRVEPPDCPALARLWPTLRIATRLTSDDYAWTALHERVWAEAVGLTGADGHYPLAAHASGRIGEACAWITPCHWHLATDHVTLADPARLQWAAGEAEALRTLLAPWFEGDGLHLEPAPPAPQGGVRWLARGPALAGLACTSIDRAVHRHVDRWLQGLDAAPALKRLQTEVQMLLYEHPSTAARIARGELPINTFWVSGAGIWDGRLSPVAPALAPGPGRPAEPAQVTALGHLRDAYLAGDVSAWRAAWQALDAQVLAPLAASGGPAAAALHLSLCGERSAVTLVRSAPGPWARLQTLFSRKNSLERAWSLLSSL